MVRDRRNHEVHQFQPVDLQPLVFPDECSLVGAVGQAVRPGIHVHHRERDGRGGDHGEGRRERGQRPQPPGTGNRAEQRELAEDVGEVGTLQACQPADRDGEPEPPAPPLQPRIGRDPLPDQQEQRHMPDVFGGDVMRRLGKQEGGEAVGKPTDEGPRPQASQKSRHGVEGAGRQPVAEQHADIQAAVEAEDLRKSREEEHLHLLEQGPVVPVARVRRTEFCHVLPGQRHKLAVTGRLHHRQRVDNIALVWLEVGRRLRPRRRRPLSVRPAPGHGHQSQQPRHDDPINPVKPGRRRCGRLARSR